eukprot:scaffold288_cov108-Isochrysis_galbana.AAC.4
MNLLVLRFANIAFGSLWNRHAIKAVQVLRGLRSMYRFTRRLLGLKAVQGGPRHAVYTYPTADA